MKQLLAFGSFADDPQRVLAAVQRLAIVGVEGDLNLGVRTAKLRATAFADREGGVLFHDPQFALCHAYSLAPHQYQGLRKETRLRLDRERKKD